MAQQGGCFLERAQHLKAGKHAEDAIEPATLRLGIEMAADGNRRQRHVFAGIGREYIANAVDLDSAAERPARGDEPIADLTVLLSQRQAGDPTFIGGAEACGRDDVVPQPVAVCNRRVDASGLGTQGFRAHFGCSGASLFSL
ncbi:hypothetical protein D9M72_451920 [compost metagenome]